MIEDDALTVLAVLVRGRLRAEETDPIAGLDAETVQAALEELRDRDLVLETGSRYVLARQRTCPGCGKRPPDGEAVISFDPESWEWRCESCEDRTEQIRWLVG